MKRSELKQLIKEELLKEALKDDWMVAYKGAEIWIKNIHKRTDIDSDAAGTLIYSQIIKALDAAQKKYKINFSKVVIDLKK